MIYSRIVGTGSYLPPRVMHNAEFEKRLDTSDAWIRERTGIGQRRIASPNEATSDMASAAARQALETRGRRGQVLGILAGQPGRGGEGKAVTREDHGLVDLGDPVHQIVEEPAQSAVEARAATPVSLVHAALRPL